MLATVSQNHILIFEVNVFWRAESLCSKNIVQKHAFRIQERKNICQS